MFDELKTQELLKVALLERRRTGGIGKEDAREEWEAIEGIGGEFDFGVYLERTKLSDAWECGASCPAHQVTGFVTKLLPRLQAKLREELEAERRAAEGSHAA